MPYGKTRRYGSVKKKVLPQRDEDFLPQRDDGMEAEEGPSILGRTDDIPISDLSIFLDDQAHEDEVWEYFVQSVLNAGRYSAYNTNDSTLDMFMAFPWGICQVTDGVAVGNPFYPPFCFRKLFGNIVNVGDGDLDHQYIGEASEANMQALVEAIILPLYRVEKNVGRYKFGWIETFNTITWGGSPTTAYDIFNRWRRWIEEAFKQDVGYGKGNRKYSAVSKLQPKYDEIGIEMAMRGGHYATKSEQFWPEIPGMATRYIDNVGIYLPDWLDIDFNLSHDFGPNFIVGVPVRYPTSGAEAFGMDSELVLDILGVALGVSRDSQGGLSQFGREVGANTGKSSGTPYGAIFNLGRNVKDDQLGRIRWLYPRIRAFGRQTSAYPTFDMYQQAHRSRGQVQSFNGHEYVTNASRYIYALTDQEYNAFVKSLGARVMTPEELRRQQILSGQAPTSLEQVEQYQLGVDEWAAESAYDRRLRRSRRPGEPTEWMGDLPPTGGGL